MASQWSLVCTDGAVPCTLQPDKATPSVLKVGRVAQGLELWERVVPKEKYRSTISREHCEIHALAGGKFNLRNHSNLGTFVNGKMIKGEVPIRLDDTVGIGSATDQQGELRPVLNFRLQAGESNSSQGQVSVSASGPQIVLECISAAGRNASMLAGLPDASKCIQGSPKLQVGRAAQGQTFWETLVPVEAERNKVSRQHFEITVDSSGRAVLVNSAGSGTIVNEERVKEKIDVAPGDIVSIPHAQRNSEIGEPVAKFRLAIGSSRPSPDATMASSYAGTLAPASGTPAAGTSMQSLGFSKEEPTYRVQDANSPFFLECISAVGLSTVDLGFLPKATRVWQPVGGKSLRIGRSLQPSDLWKQLVPNDQLQNSISREQCEICVDNRQYILRNLATCGTSVNDKMIKTQIALNPMDVIGIGVSKEASGGPVLRFRFQLSVGGNLATIL